MTAVSRIDLQKLAEVKLQDAILLLNNGRHSNGYYLAGYAIELALKAAIAKQILQHQLPDPQWIRKIYVHKLDELISLAQLKQALDKDQKQFPRLEANWAVASQWNEGSRYEMIDPYAAVAMVNAVGEKPQGVLEWLRQHW